jgi:Tfp pilus assembly protein PilX
MIPAILSPSPRRRTAHDGFALVIALSLMAFVLLLLLSITTLVQVETRSAAIASAQMEAEQAALLGLQMALGELQKAAGPDQRVTATAGINDANTAQPHLLGVWGSFKQSNEINTPINYTAQKSADFVQWLSSTATIADKTSQTYPTAAPTDSVTLVGSGTLPSPVASDPATQYVQAGTVDVLDASGNETGRYAWHVFDESQKANLTLRNPVTATDAERVSALGTAGAPNFTALAQASSGNVLYAPLENLTAEEQGKTVSLGSSALLGGATFAPQAANAFHVLTTDSKSLLVDVVNGGFQKDLSLLFEGTTLPSAYANRYIYSESNTPLEPAPTRFAGAEPMPSPDPKWSLLRSHYGLYKDKFMNKDGILENKISIVDGAYGVAASNVERDAATGFFDEQQLLPVVSNAQFIFSLTTAENNNTPPDIGYLHLFIDPVITLWNPYTVELRFPQMEMEFYRFPLEIDFKINDVSRAEGDGFVNIANMFNASNGGGWGAQDDKPYRARIHPTVGDEIVMKPGEYKIFSSYSGYTRHHAQGQYTGGVILKEGWVPGGNGGVGTRFLMADDAGLSTGTVGGAWIKLKADDDVTMAVRAGKVSRAGTGFVETNDEEIASYLKVFQGDGGAHSLGVTKTVLDQNRTQVGAIELDLADLSQNLPSILPSDLPTYTPPANVPAHWLAYQGKVPFLNASLRLKTELGSNDINSAPNSSLWLHNGVTNPYFTTGITGDQNEHEKSHQYELTWTGMTSWNDTPGVEYNPTNKRGYGGTGVTSGTGVEFAPYHQIPLAPATSLAQFSHAPINAGGQAPLTSQIVGNSFNSPLIPLVNKSSAGTLGTHLDHSYMANNALFDGYFLSTAAVETGALTGSSRGLATVLSDFFDGTQPLRNSNVESATSVAPTVTAADYETFAQHLFYKGAFNVNSTSEEAWALFLASGTNEALPILEMLTASTTLAGAVNSSDLAVSRFAPMIGDEIADDPAITSISGQERWAEHRRLTPDQIMRLAGNVVAEVKARGPFQSVAEFVNRQLVNTAATGSSGALQNAIENSALNADFGKLAPKKNSELTAGFGSGNTSDGAATQITQADLLNRLAPSLTVRGDTFRIRAYGETASLTGEQTTKVWCEAVVQRQHDFVDGTQVPTTTIDASLSTTNQAFGRRFKVVSFRWLSADEV